MEALKLRYNQSGQIKISDIDEIKFLIGNSIEHTKICTGLMPFRLDAAGLADAIWELVTKAEKHSKSVVNSRQPGI